MNSYRIVLEEIIDGRRLKRILEEVGETYATVNTKRNEVEIETDVSVADICEFLEEEGYEIVDVELL